MSLPPNVVSSWPFILSHCHFLYTIISLGFYSISAFPAHKSLPIILNMQTSCAFQLEVSPRLAMVYGFTLTDRYLIAAAQRCVVYSHDPLRPGKQADFDIGFNWEVKCLPESSLLLVATWDAAG